MFRKGIIGRKIGYYVGSSFVYTEGVILDKVQVLICASPDGNGWVTVNRYLLPSDAMFGTADQYMVRRSGSGSEIDFVYPFMVANIL